MAVTIVLSLILMGGFFLLLWSAVGFIQDKRLFKTAPRDIQEAVTEHPERFPGQRMIGWRMASIAMTLLVCPFLYGGYDGWKNGFTMQQFFIRFLTMLYLLKAFDIIFFDWYLLTRSHFFQHYYPETEGCRGYHSFGFNWKGQLLRIVLFPFAAWLMAWICTLFN